MRECPIDFTESRTIVVSPVRLSHLIKYYILNAYKNSAYDSASLSLAMLDILDVLTEVEHEQLVKLIDQIYLTGFTEEEKTCVENPVE